MNKSNNARFQETEKRIVECTLGLIEKNPKHLITVTDICEELSLNRSSFYLHHKSIQSLLDAIMDRYRAELMSESQLDRTSISAAAHRWLLFAAEYQSFYCYYIRFSENPSQSRQYLWECLETLVPSLQDKNSLTEVQRTFLEEFLEAGLSAGIRNWLSTGKEDSVDEIVELLTRIFRSLDTGNFLIE